MSSESMLTCVQVPLLQRRDGKYHPNLHHSITTMLEEAKWMSRLNLKIPEILHIITIANVKRTYSQLLVRHVASS